MSESADAAPKVQAKMPLVKRIIILVRGKNFGLIMAGVGGAILIVLILAALSFSGGVAVGLKRNKQNETVLQQELQKQRNAYDKLQAHNTALEKQVSDAKALTDAQTLDLKVLRDDVERLRLEKQALEKVMNTVQERLFGKAGAGGAALAPVQKKCAEKGGPLRSKEDVECLNLREAIQAMNSRPAKPGAEAAKAPEAAKPAAAGHGH